MNGLRNRPEMRRLRWWWDRRLGWPGAVALVILVGTALIGGALRPWVETQRRELLRAHVARLDAAARSPGNAARSTRDPRDTLRDSLPTLDQRGRVIADFLAVAGRAKVPLAQAEYAVEDQEPALSRLRVSVPVSDSYARVRALIAAELDQLPNAALDKLEMESAGDGALLDSRLQFSLWFRREARP